MTAEQKKTALCHVTAPFKKLCSNKNFANIAAGLAVVLLANVLLLSGFTHTMEITTEVGTFYIKGCRKPFVDLFNLDASWGPLYLAWLKPIFMVLGDSFATYFANIFALSFVVTALVFVLINRMTKRPALGIAAAFLWLLCQFNILLEAKVAAFALLIVLVGAIAARSTKTTAQRYLTFAVFMLVASYARPELFAAFVLALLAGLFFLVKNRTNKDIAGYSLAALSIVPAIGLKAINYLPVLDDKSGRTAWAIKDHFTKSWLKAGNRLPPDMSYKQANDWVWKNVFGDAEGLTSAFVASPIDILMHLWSNFVLTLARVFECLFYHFPVILPKNSPASMKAEGLLLGVVILTTVIHTLVNTDTRKKLMDKHGAMLSLWLAPVAASIAASVTVYPNMHYILHMGMAILVLAACSADILIDHYKEQKGETVKCVCCSKPMAKWIVMAVVVVLATPNPFAMPFDASVRGHTSPMFGKASVFRPVYKTIGFIKSLDIREPINMFNTANGYEYYLDHNINTHTAQRMNGRSFSRMMDLFGFKLVVDPHRNGPSMLDKTDGTWRHFKENAASMGFTAVQVPGTNSTVYINSRLNCRHAACTGQSYDPYATLQQHSAKQPPQKSRHSNGAYSSKRLDPSVSTLGKINAGEFKNNKHGAN